MMVAIACTMLGHSSLPPKNLTTILLMRMMKWVVVGMLISSRDRIPEVLRGPSAG
jgi:hypothetical protein